MENRSNRVRQIELLQDNLQSLRKLAGWTIEEFGEKIGVTKQTVSNLENKKTRLSQTQYIAIRTVLDYEIYEHPENTILQSATSFLLDEGRFLSEEDYAKVKKSVETIAAAASGGIEKSVLSTLFSNMVGTVALSAGIEPILHVGLAGGIIGGLWLRGILSGDKNKEQSK